MTDGEKPNKYANADYAALEAWLRSPVGRKEFNANQVLSQQREKDLAQQLSIPEEDVRAFFDKIDRQNGRY